MRINGTGRTSGTSPTARKKASRPDGDSFEGALGEVEATATAPLRASGPVASVAGLLALQEAPDATTGRSKGLARAEDLLNQLEEVRRGIVMGVIPAPRLEALVRTVRAKKTETGDPRLNSLLEEVELRALVELAKLGIYL